MRYDHIAWDFNGTILDDVQTGMEATNILLRRRGLPEIPSRAVYDRLFGFPIEDYYVRIGFDFSKETYAAVADEWAVEYRRLEVDAPLRPGVQALMEAFYQAHIPQTVLSASEKTLLHQQLSRNGLLSYFEAAVGRDDFIGDDKTANACRWAEQRRPGRVLMIGDTDHDAATAAAAGFSCVLVAGGHQGRDRLLACGCPVVEDFAALLTALREEGCL